MIEVPAGFAEELIGREGEAGRSWIASLPELFDEFVRRWDCAPAGAVMCGRVGLVLPVERHDGTPAVLKASFPHPGNVNEPYAYAAWDGRGAVRLLARDDARFVMLLERAERATLADVGDDDEAVALSGRLARRLAVPAPPGFPRLGERVFEWEAYLREDAGRHPLPRRVIDAAVATIRELGPDQPDTLVHGDLHYGNVLRGHREPWLAIDPKGFAGDPAFDAKNALIGGVPSLLAADDLNAVLQRRLAIFADAAELDRERVRRWAQVRVLRSAYHYRNPLDSGTGPSERTRRVVRLGATIAELLA